MMRSDKCELSLLAIVLLLAAVLRVGWPTLSEFKFSEARLEALALELTREGRIPLVGVPSSAGFDHSPVSVYLYMPAFLFTSNPVPATIYGGLVGTAAVALCWWLARRWSGGGQWAALLATLLFAASPWAVAFSRKIWQVAFVPLLTLAFIGLLISALIEGPSPYPSKERRWRLAWALAIYGLLVQVHPSTVALAPALLLWLIVFWRRVRIAPLFAGGLLAAFTAMPFLVHQAQGGWPALDALRSLPKAEWDLAAIRLAWEAITGRNIHALSGSAYPLLKTVPQLGWFFNIIGWLTVGASLWLIWRMWTHWRNRKAGDRQAAQVDLVLLSWLTVPILFNLRHSLDLHLHFLIFVAPAAYLIIGRALQDVVSRLWTSATPGRIPVAHSHVLIVAGAGALGLLALAQVSALVLMAHFVSDTDTPGGFGTPLGHYLEIANQTVEQAKDRDVAEVLVVGKGDSTVVDEIPSIFDVLLHQRVPHRFVDGRSAAVFPPHNALLLVTPEPGATARWYSLWPTYKLQYGYHLVTLDGAWPQETLQPVTGPRAFQNGIELQGFAWETTKDDQGRFSLLWQVLWLDPHDTHFYLHLLGHEGQLWGQQDSVGYPTAHRQKGDRIVSEFYITDQGPTSSGPHTARVGLYFYPQVINVPVIDDAGNPIDETVTMGPLDGGP
jgi:hypothetical protein